MPKQLHQLFGCPLNMKWLCQVFLAMEGVMDFLNDHSVGVAEKGTGTVAMMQQMMGGEGSD